MMITRRLKTTYQQVFDIWLINFSLESIPACNKKRPSHGRRVLLCQQYGPSYEFYRGYNAVKKNKTLMLSIMVAAEYIKLYWLL